MKIIYLTMCVIGFVLPWTQFGPWLMENEFSFSVFSKAHSVNVFQRSLGMT